MWGLNEYSEEEEEEEEKRPSACILDWDYLLCSFFKSYLEKIKFRGNHTVVWLSIRAQHYFLFAKCVAMIQIPAKEMSHICQHSKKEKWYSIQNSLEFDRLYFAHNLKKKKKKCVFLSLLSWPILFHTVLCTVCTYSNENKKWKRMYTKTLTMWIRDL